MIKRLKDLLFKSVSRPHEPRATLYQHKARQNLKFRLVKIF